MYRIPKCGLYHLRVYPSTLPCGLSVKTEAHNAQWNEKPRSLATIFYAARLIDLNEYLASFPGATLTEKLGVTELEEILLNSMPNI